MAASGTAPRPETNDVPPPHVDKAEREAERLAFVVLVRAEQNVTAARFYENVHFLVGALASGLAAAAGGTAFAGETTIAGIAAIAAAALTGFLTIHRPEERTASHWRAARDYGRLYDYLTLYFTAGWKPALAELELGSSPESAPGVSGAHETAAAERTEALARFTRRAGEIEEGSFPVPERLCRKAEDNIAGQDEWVAPAGGDFDAWRNRVMTGGRRGRLRRTRRA